MALIMAFGLMSCTYEPIPIPMPSPSIGLLLPDLKAESPAVMYIRANTETGERELWFSTVVVNIGDGPLELIGEYDERLNETRAIQRKKTKQGTFEESIVGHFIFHEGHDHWHFEDFAELEILSSGSTGPLAGLMGTTGKTTFCLQDSARLSPPPPNTPEKAVYGSCDPVVQGLSVGWADIYDPTMPGQQLNINGLPDGRYAIRTTADPSGLILEKDESNNSSVVHVEIVGMRISIVDPPSASPRR